MRKKTQQSLERIQRLVPNVNDLQKQYSDELETDPEYSLVPDPTGKYNMSETMKTFISHYVQFKSVASAAELTGIEKDEAKRYFIMFDVQNEIRRINRALYHRQFLHRLLTIDELGGYLASLLTDENVPLADQLRTTDKLRVVDMLIKLNEMKAAAFDNPTQSAATDIEYNIKQLSVTTIQNLLVANTQLEEKRSAIGKLDDGTLTQEEREYLSTLPLKDLLELVEESTKLGGKS